MPAVERVSELSEPACGAKLKKGGQFITRRLGNSVKASVPLYQRVPS